MTCQFRILSSCHLYGLLFQPCPCAYHTDSSPHYISTVYLSYRLSLSFSLSIYFFILPPFCEFLSISLPFSHWNIARRCLFKILFELLSHFPTHYQSISSTLLLSYPILFSCDITFFLFFVSSLRVSLKIEE